MNQILGESQMAEACGEHPLCVIAFLPNILDCQVHLTVFLGFYTEFTHEKLLLTKYFAPPELNPMHAPEISIV